MTKHCMFLLFLPFLMISAGPLHQDEEGSIGEPVMLTDPAIYLKAGESYFDPSGTRIIFQAIEQPKDGEEPESEYGMYIADLAFSPSGAITGLTNVERISNEGSANTCGWFHPSNEHEVLFATTTTPLVDRDIPGYQRSSGRYRWAFPPKMNIVSCDLSNGNAMSPLITDDTSYLAEGSWSNDGRHIVYCSLATGAGDIYITDLKTNTNRLIVGDTGYDGGPFFSPDGKRIVYRSDRRGDDLLQLYVADLKFDENGSIVGIEREYQLTNNEHVNWGPFWHPNGRFLIYATSQISHRNYELFVCDADNGETDGTIRYGTNKRRITFADGFDGLPVFDSTGKWLMWTSKRVTNTSQIWVAPFLFDLDAKPTVMGH